MKKNVKEAYLVEQEYLKTDRQGKQLVDLLKELDYTLDEYFEDKKEYLLRSNKTYIELLDNKSLDDIFEKVNGAMSNEIQSCYLSYNDDMFIWTGSDKLDEEKAKQYNIPVHKMNYIGGTMVIDKQDLSGAIVVPAKFDINFDYFIKRFYDFFKSKGENDILIDGNDILINNKKVFGGASYKTEKMYAFLFVATFSDNLEIIKEFCLINENKQPGFITKTTSDELIKEILTWLKDI